MSASSEQDQEKIWEAYSALDRNEQEPALVVDVDGFEGPLDLLLELARTQKVDIARISILALANQYLAYIEQIRRVRLELAGAVARGAFERYLALLNANG